MQKKTEEVKEEIEKIKTMPSTIGEFSKKMTEDIKENTKVVVTTVELREAVKEEEVKKDIKKTKHK